MNGLSIPDYALCALKRLWDKGFEAYLVGGCVRDMLMGRSPSDYDITTSALPKQVEGCFEEFRTIETGIKHGTVTVLIDRHPLEITTYRIDGNYTDNRRPDSVSFSGALTDDLKRRDFTVNAIAYSPLKGLVDPYNGQRDINLKIIRCVGSPRARFFEDGLRILRALRFSAVLGFEPDGQTACGIKECAFLLKNISGERIYSELIRTLCAHAPGRILQEFRDVFQVVLPELSALSAERYNQMTAAVDGTGAEKNIRLAALLMPMGAEAARDVLKRLRADGKTIQGVADIIEGYRNDIGTDQIAARRLLRCHTLENIMGIIDVKRAYGLLTAEQAYALGLNVTGAIERGDCVSLKALAIKGYDIIEAKIASGVGVGIILESLLDLVIEGKAENDRKALMETAQKLLANKQKI